MSTLNEIRQRAVNYQHNLLGKLRVEAERMAAGQGFVTRVVSEDGMPYYATPGYVPGRFNLTLVDGRVTEVEVG